MDGFCSPNNENAGFYSRWNSAKTATVTSLHLPDRQSPLEHRVIIHRPDQWRLSLARGLASRDDSGIFHRGIQENPWF
jgi:hypothetical protein